MKPHVFRDYRYYGQPKSTAAESSAKRINISLKTYFGPGAPSATIFCETTVRRGKYCLEISKAWERLKISG